MREDTEAERLYEAYSDRILRYCVRQLGCRSDAEDAVQTTFLYALRALRRGTQPECESAWLHTIAKNVCRWQQRTASRRGPVSNGVDVDLLPNAERDEDVELLAGLRDALGSLPARQRRALVLREWHGVAPREIAVELGMTGPQTHALLTRARHSLAQALSAPRRAALGLGSLVFELRAHVKTLLGGASAKVAATATIAVTGVGVGGVAIEHGFGNEQTSPQRVVPASETGSGGVPSSSAARFASGRSPAVILRVGSGRAATVPSSPTGSLPKSNGEPTTPRPGFVPETPPVGGDPSPEPGPRPEHPTAPGQELPVTLPLDPPTLDPPTLDLPPLDLPPLPGVDLPPVDLPPAELPPVPPLPQVELPPVELPPAPPVPPLPPVLPS